MWSPLRFPLIVFEYTPVLQMWAGAVNGVDQMAQPICSLPFGQVD